MNKEDIIRMAREAWFDDGPENVHVPKELERFAALVAAAAIKDAPDYKIGYADGVAAEREAKDELLAALQDLLMDTQHAEHQCGDKNCPVANAKSVALKYDAIRARGQA